MFQGIYKIDHDETNVEYKRIIPLLGVELATWALQFGHARKVRVRLDYYKAKLIKVSSSS